jgi:hypothetical protein
MRFLFWSANAKGAFTPALMGLQPCVANIKTAGLQVRRPKLADIAEYLSIIDCAKGLLKDDELLALWELTHFRKS